MKTQKLRGIPYQESEVIDLKNKILTLTLCLALLALCMVTGVVVLAADDADITIHFVYDPNIEGTIAANLPSAMKINLSGEESFSETFVIQQLVGYEPTVIMDRQITKGETPADNVAGASVETVDRRQVVKFDNMTIDSAKLPLHFYVYYTAIDVNYRVKYYFQNVDNDNYTELATLAQAGKAKTGTVFSDDQLAAMVAGNANLPADFEKGYRLLHAIPDMVAADGSTVFQTYFDRQYYSIDFDLDGGYGVDPIYARYGANVTVGVPVRPGYTFTGWVKAHTIDGYEDIPATIPTVNLKYKAQWEKNLGSASYTVAYWAYEATGERYLLDSKVITGVDPDATVSGSDDFVSSLVCNKQAHTHDASCSLDANHTVHSLSCGVPTTFSATTLNINDENAIAALGTLESGYVYVIRTQNDINYSQYWLKYYVYDQWYEISYALSKSGLSNYVVDVDTPIASTGSVNGYYAYKYAVKVLPNCPTACGQPAHTHTDSCYAGSHYLLFKEADQNVTVKGDGTTVVNVYYTHRNYTLRFYYARSYVGTGNLPVYQVVGGTTWSFGYPKNTSPKTNLETALENVAEDQWGIVSKPIVDATYLAQTDSLGKKYFATGTDVFNKNGTNYTYYYFEFTAPFGSDISSLWPVDKFNSVEIQTTHTGHTVGSTDDTSKCKYGNYAYFSAWNGEDRVKYTQENDNPTVKGKYTILDENLIFNSAYEDSQEAYTDEQGRSSYLVNYLCFWENGADVSWSIPKKFVYHIYKKDPTTNAYVLSETFDVYDNSDLTEVNNQTKISLKGYKCVDVSYEDATQAGAVIPTYNYYFYYNLVDDQTVTFKNEGATEFVVKDQHYGALLKNCLGSFDPSAPAYPSTLEAGAYTFRGWCTSYPCTEDTLVNLNTYTIPEGNAILYAYWEKKTYDITFLDSVGGSVVSTYEDITHGDSLNIAIDDPTTGNANDYFIGWFYMDGTERKKFDPMITPIEGNLEIFAMWEGTTPRQYTVRFVTKDSQGVEVEVADPITGYARQNSTKTFLAKGGAELYANYQTKYYPLTQSHSIVIGENNNTYTFEYYYVETDLSYTVRYVDAATGLNLPINENGIVNGEITKAVSTSYVTENYYPYDAYYIPDSYKKSLVLSVKKDADGNYVNDADKNVIVFEYTKQEEKTGYYIVNFYLEKLDNDAPLTVDNCIFASSVESAFKIQSHQIALPAFTGFVVDSQSGGTSIDIDNKTVTFDVSETGTEVNVFYKRESYSYTVEIIAGSNTETFKDVGKMEYGATAIYNLSDKDKTLFDGYKPSATSGSVVITEDSKQNVIVFQYDPIKYEMRYVAVSFDKGVQQSVGTKGGMLSLSTETTYYGSSGFKGSKATEKEYYRFVGWYTDAACTNLITSESQLTPKVSMLDESTATCFYAKFERLTADLVIIRENAEDQHQMFVYKIIDKETKDVIFVAICGNGSVTIKDMLQGEYTVVQQSDWSWRYAEESKACELTGKTELTFGGDVENDRWLNGNSPINPGA